MEQENNLNTIKMIPIHSSSVAAIGYDEKGKLLKVAFKNKTGYTNYIYSDVEKETYNNIINSDSKGKALRESIIKFPDKYKYRKI